MVASYSNTFSPAPLIGPKRSEMLALSGLRHTAATKNLEPQSWALMFNGSMIEYPNRLAWTRYRMGNEIEGAFEQNDWNQVHNVRKIDLDSS